MPHKRDMLSATAVGRPAEPAPGSAAAHPPPAAKILLVEDDGSIAGDICEAIRREGLAVTWCPDAETAETALLQGDYKVFLVDRNLPGLDGMSFIERLRRQRDDASILVLSALDSVEQRVTGLEGGADDYLAKPFALTELMARIHAQLRRPLAKQETQLCYASLVVDLVSRTVRSDGELIELLPREFRLLVYFMQRSEQLVTRDMLLRNVWHYEFLPQTNLVDVHLGRLRRKIDRPGRPSLIQNVRGAGFILRAD